MIQLQGAGKRFGHKLLFEDCDWLITPRERTGLAWRRTSLAFALNGVLLARATDAWLQVAALVVLALAAGIAASSAMTFRDSRATGWFAAGPRRSELLLVAVVAVCILDLIAISR